MHAGSLKAFVPAVLLLLGALPYLGTFGVPLVFDDLPANARAYLQRVETLTGVPIAMISTGADREETILRHHPWINTHPECPRRYA